MFALNQSSLIKELIEAKKRGVHVVTIMDKVQADSTNEDEALDAAGVVALRYENKRGGSGNFGLVELHNKLCIIDGKKGLPWLLQLDQLGFVFQRRKYGGTAFGPNGDPSQQRDRPTDQLLR